MAHSEMICKSRPIYQSTPLSFLEQYAAPVVDLYSSTDCNPLLSLIGDSETKYIDIEIYAMADKDVRDAIRAALKRGVRVRIVKEPAPNGESCRVFPNYKPAHALPPQEAYHKTSPKDPSDCADQQALVHDIEVYAKNGSAYVPYNKPAFCLNPDMSCFEHGKIAIINGAVALISTGNFDSTSFCNLKYDPERCNRDYTMVTSVPEVVRTLAAVFERDLKGKSYDLADLLAKVGSPKVTVSPRSIDQLITFIKSAKKSIRIQAQYLKEPRINEALQSMAKKVRVMVNAASPCSFGKPSDSDKKKFTQIYTAFDAAGIVSRMFTDRQTIGGRPGYMHAKAIVVDDERAWVGSINGSTPSVSNNREFGVIFNDAGAVQKLVKQMQEDFTSPNSESWREGLACLKDTPRH